MSTVPNPLQDALRELAEMLAEQSHFLHLKATPVQEWMDAPVLRDVIQKLWDEGVSWGYERAKAEDRQQDEARGWALVRVEERVKELRATEAKWTTRQVDTYNATLAQGSVSTCDAVLTIIQEEKP